MTPRENILNLFRRQGYEHVPCQFGLCPSLHETYKQVTGSATRYEEHFAFPWRGVQAPALPACEVDWSTYYAEPFKQGTRVDHWGVAREPGSADAKHMTHMRHPMASLDSAEEIEAYPFPAFGQADWSPTEASVKEVQSRGLAAQTVIGDMIWEIAWYLRSMEELMMDMASDDEKATLLLDRVTELSCIRAAGYARAGVDILHTGDDVGMQQSVMMSEEMYREWIKPRFAKVIAAAKAEKPDIILSYHSCGYVIPFIEDFIEIGVDVLNPVQPECMDFQELHDQYGDRLSFWGTIGTQTTMPFGTPAEVRDLVHHNLAIAGDKGGLLPTPTHLLEPEVPWENVAAYVEACQSFK